MRRPRLSILAYVITLLVLTTLICGMLGYPRIADRLSSGINSQGPVSSFLDYLYLSLGLLLVGGKDTFGDPFLIVGRWTGALFAFVAIIKLGLPKLESELRRHWIIAFGGHTIVVGQGEKGKCFLRELSRTVRCIGIDKVALEFQSLERATDQRPLKRSRILLLRGDATEPEVLELAGLHRAARVIVVTHDDLINLEVARQIAVLAGRRAERAPRLDVIVHLADRALRLEGLSSIQSGSRLRIRPFSLPALAARRLISRWPFAIRAREQGAAAAHLVLVGFDAYAEELLLLLLRLGALLDQSLPRVSIFAGQAAVVERRLQHNHPALPGLASGLRVYEFDPGIDFAEADMAAVEADLSHGGVTAIVVSAETDTQAIALASRVRSQSRRFGLWRAPIFVHTEQPAEFSQAFSSVRQARFLDLVLEPFGDIESLCAAISLQDWHETLAERIHAGYLVDSLALRRGASVAAEVHWHSIREEFRDANRRVVDHFPLLLASAGHIIRDEPPLPVTPLKFTDAQLNRFAWLEHQSWSAERRISGWRYAQPRDDRRKLHDCLVPFEQLGEERQKDRSQILRMSNLINTAIAGAPDTTAPTLYRERVIGLVGQHHITPAQARLIAATAPALLEEMRVRERLGHGGDEFWTFVTPLAPGAELVLAGALLSALASLTEARVSGRYRLLVFAPGSPEQMAAAYLASGPDLEMTLDGRQTLSCELEYATDRYRQELKLADVMRRFVTTTDGVEWATNCAVTDPCAQTPIATQALAECDAYLLRQCQDLITAHEPRRFEPAAPFSAAHAPRGDGADASAALALRWLQRTMPADQLTPLFAGGLRVLQLPPP